MATYLNKGQQKMNKGDIAWLTLDDDTLEGVTYLVILLAAHPHSTGYAPDSQAIMFWVDPRRGFRIEKRTMFLLSPIDNPVVIWDGKRILRRNQS